MAPLSSGCLPGRWRRKIPSFAGEPLPYYWLYDWIGAGLALMPGVSSLVALQLMTLVSLAAMVMLAMDVGRRLTGAIGAGALIGLLALAGANPLGPIIATAHVGRGRDVMTTEAATPPEAVFVSDSGADRMMSRPLLGDLYFGSDWRSGQNIVWFWDISSRAPALAALMLLVWSLVRDAARLTTVFAMLLVTLLNSQSASRSV